VDAITVALLQRWTLQAMQIADTTLGSAASSLTFASLPGLGFNQGSSLLVVTSTRTAATGVIDELLLRYNGDAGSNYRSETEQGAGNTLTAGLTDPETGIWLALVPTASAPAHYFGTSLSVVPFYSGTSWDKNCLSYGFGDDGSTTPYITLSGGTWLNSAAISSLTFTLKSGSNIAAGSRFTVYLLP
jgi:hypothetical protein